MSAWQLVDIYTHPDGTVSSQTVTNDNEDRGYDNGHTTEWALTFPSVEKALKHHGRCRIGVSGIRVTVRLDGKEVR